MKDDVLTRIKSDNEERARTGACGLKVNLYTGLDVAALDQAVDVLDESVRLECVMVGDSILNTHYGRSTTRLDGAAESDWGLRVLNDALAEVSAALRASARLGGVYLMADLPDGSLESPARLTAAAERFMVAGADAVKLEVSEPAALRGIEQLASAGLAVFGHIGFTPQTTELRRYGRTVGERAELYGLARAVRDSGACGVILEMVDPQVNAALSAPSPHRLPCFSIFSGPPVAGGGFSVNAWDAVFRHPSGAPGFPPSAFLDPGDYPEQYTLDHVTQGLSDLLGLVVVGQFPPAAPGGPTAPYVEEDPWQTLGR